MSKSTISEKFVQRAVADRLNRDYYRRSTVYSGTETYTRLKRADVLLAFLRSPKRPYVVVVEAKSRTTIGQLKLSSQPEKTVWWSRGIALILITILLSITGYQWYSNALNTFILLALFLAGVVLIGRGLEWLQLRFVKSIPALEQLAGYPANESWIAISTDTFAKSHEYHTLRRQCRKAGIGLIVVNAKGKLSLKRKPRPRQVFNDYLGRYGKKTEILAKLKSTTAFGPTPGEKRQRLRQSLVLFAGLLFVGSAGLLTYEENYGPVVMDPIATGHLDLPAVISADSSSQVIIPENLPINPVPQACGSLALPDKSYLVVDQVCKSAPAALIRMQELTAANISPVQFIPADCFQSWAKVGTFVIYTGSIFTTRDEAQKAAKTYQKQLKKAGIQREYGKIMKVKPRLE